MFLRFSLNSLKGGFSLFWGIISQELDTYPKTKKGSNWSNKKEVKT